MRRHVFAVPFAFVFLLSGCGGGAMLAEPTVAQSDVSQARQALATHELEPSRNLAPSEMQSTLDRVWESLKSPLIQTCARVFSSGCWGSVNNMRVIAVNRNDINAYADASNFTIGVHAGFLRSAGDDDEIAAVLAHEAAHLLFRHAEKKQTTAATSGLLTGIAMGALGAAVHQPGMDTQYIGDMIEGGFHTGWNVGYVAYSPEMEIEADQFAMYVLKQANRRLTAGTDLIVRLHRGDVPVPVRRGDGWASYLATHPADDYRLAAMRSTLNDIRAGATRPLSTHEAAERERLQLAAQNRERKAALCKTLVEEYPECEWWYGKFDWGYLVDCPAGWSKKAIDGRGACLQ